MFKFNFFNKRPKTRIGLFLLALPLFCVVCIFGIIIFFYFISFSTGEKADSEIRDWLEDQNAVIAKSSSFVDGVWLDPAFFFRFHIDIDALEKFKNKRQLKLIKTDMCEQTFSAQWPVRWFWGPPDMSAHGCWTNSFEGNYYYLYKDHNSHFVYLYVQNT